MSEIAFARAITAALQDELAADPTVVLIGEDIGAAGGTFGVTKGLLDQFGPVRVRDTPISEAVSAGAAVGAAMSGLRPVLEVMFMDFSTLVMDAMVNQAAKARFMFGGQCSIPMVLRTPHGGGLSAGPQHSQCLEAWFAHIPGLKVVCPATAQDAYGLLRAAIRDPDPVVFVENRALYARKGPLDRAAPLPAIGQGQVVATGQDLTVVTYGASLETALGARAVLAEAGHDVEVIDLRSLQPWDEKLVLASLAKTHRLLVLHEAVEAFGVGAEIAARMAEYSFDELDAPIVRVGAPFMPVPFSPALERRYVPSVDQVVAKARRMLA